MPSNNQLNDSVKLCGIDAITVIAYREASDGVATIIMKRWVTEKWMREKELVQISWNDV